LHKRFFHDLKVVLVLLYDFRQERAVGNGIALDQQFVLYLFNVLLDIFKDELLELFLEPVDVTSQFEVHFGDDLKCVDLLVLEDGFQSVGRFHQNASVLLNKLISKLFVDYCLSTNTEALRSDLHFYAIKLIDLFKVFGRI